MSVVKRIGLVLFNLLSVFIFQVSMNVEAVQFLYVYNLNLRNWSMFGQMYN